MVNSKNWKQTTLGEVAVVDWGNTKLTKKSYIVDGRFLGVSAAGPDGRMEHVEHKAGTTVISAIGEYCGRVFRPRENFTAIKNTMTVTAQEGLADPDFLYYLLSRNTIPRRGSSQPFLSKGDTKSWPIQIPDLEEQKSIAAVLSSLDDKIELLRAQNKTLEEMAQRLFKEWFVDFNFPNEDGKPYKKSGGRMVESEMGEIPEGWRVGQLSDEFDIIMGQSPKGESYNLHGEGMVFFQGRAEFQERFPQIRLYTTEPKRTAEQFDVLVSVRAPVGDINVASEACCIGRGLAAVRSSSRSYSLYKIKSLKYAFDKFEAEGTVFGSINKTGFENIETVIPTSEIVEKFETKMRGNDLKIFNNYRQSQSLCNLRDVLLPKLMSGEILL